MLTRATASAAFSIPMATAVRPKLCARSITVLQSGALTLSVPQSVTKLRSSLSSANGNSPGPRQRRVAAAEIVDREPDIVPLQPIGQFAGEREVGDDLLLRHVDDQPGPFFGIRVMRFHDFLDRQLDQAV